MASPITLRLELTGGKCEFVVGSFFEEIESIEDSRSHSMYVLKDIYCGLGEEEKSGKGREERQMLSYKRKKRWGTIFSLPR